MDSRQGTIRCMVERENATEQPLRLLMIDEHTLFRHGVRLILGDLGRPVAIEEADSVQAAVTAMEGHQPPPDMVLLDLRMPGGHGMDAVIRAREAFQGARIVIVSGEDDPALVYDAIELGVVGFIPKSATASVLISALRLVLVGGIYLPRHVLDYRRSWGAGPARQIAAHPLQPSSGGTARSTRAESANNPPPATSRPTAAAASSRGPRAADHASISSGHVPIQRSPHEGPNNGSEAVDGASMDRLTSRQREVLTRVVRGMSNKLIARELALSESTVKQHLSSAYKLLGVNSRTQAVFIAASMGLATQAKNGGTQ